MDLKQLFQLFALAPQVQKWINLGLPIVTELQKLNQSNMIEVLSDIGSKMFPKVSGQIKIVAAAADALMNPQGMTWVQNALNRIDKAGLVVDGVGGEKTKAAVVKFQTAHQPDAGPVDGWAGLKTKAAIAVALAKLAPA